MKLKALIGNAANYISIMTFHSYCFDMLGKVGDLEKSGDIIEHMDKNDELRVIAVGDDDQNIYQFRGSSSAHFESLMGKRGAKSQRRPPESVKPRKNNTTVKLELFLEGVKPVKIRKTAMRDLDEVCGIYAWARDFMRESGNPNQWKAGHPAREIIENDVNAGKSYVSVCGDEIAAVFYYSIEIEPTYAKIDGKWQNDEAYGVVHRIARSRDAKGAGAFCLDWCFEQCGNIRIDTHRDNLPMIRLLEKLDFKYCGIIWMEDGDERLAYQKYAG